MPVADYTPLFQAAGQKYNVDPALLAAVAQTESSGNPNAVGPATKYGTASGLMQILPSTAKSLGVQDTTDPAQAIDGAAKLLSQNLDRYGSPEQAILAYHGGTDPANWGPQTQDYLAKVTKNYNPSPFGQPTQVAANNNVMSDATVDAPADKVSVRLPNGKIINNVPRDMSKADLVAKLKANGIDTGDSAPQQQGGYFSRTGADISNSLQQGANAVTSGDNPLSAALQAGGHAVDAVFAPIGEALPDFIKNPLSRAASTLSNLGTQGAQYIADKLDSTAAGQAFGDYGMNSPNLQAGLESTKKGAIGAAKLLTAGIGNAATGFVAEAGAGALESGGKALNIAADAQVAAKKADFAQDLVSPKQTNAVKVGQVGRTSSPQGLLGKQVINPSPQEAAMANEVAKLPVSASNTLQENYNIVAGANKLEAQDLIDRIKKNDVGIDPDNILNALQTAKDKLASNPYLVGDGQKAANSVIDNALDIISKNKQTASGLLESRKEFDNLVRSQKPNAFDPARENPVSNAILTVRQAINDVVDQAVPQADVKESLAKQMNLYRAMDNIAPKAANEASTNIGRLGQKLNDAIPIRGDVKGLTAAAAGLGGAGALAYAAPAIIPAAAGAGALYGLYRAGTSPAALRSYAGTLNTGAKIVRKGLRP